MADPTPKPAAAPTGKHYDKTDNVLQRLAKFSRHMNVLTDAKFSGFSKRTNTRIEWDYLSIHAIRGIINREAAPYGLIAHTKSEAPNPNILPEETVTLGGMLVCRAWQNVYIRNIDDPTDFLDSGPTSAEVPCTDDKSMAKAKQLAAKGGFIDVLNIAVGIDPDASLNEIPQADAAIGETVPPARASTPAKQTPAEESLIVKLQPAQIARFRTLISEQGLVEAPLLAEVSRGRANRLDLPLSPQTIRNLMTKLKVDEGRINSFISALVADQPANVPPPTHQSRNAAVALKRGVAVLPEPAQQAFLRGIGLDTGTIEKLTDEQAAPLLARFENFRRSLRSPRNISPASARPAQREQTAVAT